MNNLYYISTFYFDSFLFFFIVLLFMFILICYNLINLLFFILFISCFNQIIIELIIYSKLITYTTNTSSINYAITKLCTPLKIFKINPLFISMSITLTIRFIPIVINEINTIVKSLKVKGIYFSKDIKKNIIILKQIIKPIFKNSILKADKIANAIELKYFDFNKKRSNYFEYKFKLQDIIFLAIFVLITIFIIRSEI